MPDPSPPAPAATVARIVVFAAFIAVLGLFPGIYVGGSGIPVVLQNMGPVLAAAIVGTRAGTAATALWLALAALGLPFLTGGRGGLGPFAGISSGFLYGYLLAALVTGLVVARLGRPRVPGLLLAALLGFVADYVVGIAVWAAFVGSLGTAAVQSLVFVPGDLVKIVVIALVAAIVHRALPHLTASRGRARPAPESGPSSSGPSSSEPSSSEPSSSEPPSSEPRTSDRGD